MVWLPFHELPRGGHPVSSLAHYTVQAYNNTRFSKGGLPLQSAAGDPLVREYGHFVFQRCGALTVSRLVSPRLPAALRKRSRDVLPQFLSSRNHTTRARARPASGM